MKETQLDKNVIYGLWCTCHPGDGVRYVGQTKKGMTARFGVHLAHSKSVQAPVYNWIRKHGAENIAYTILEICLPDELDAREEVWISHYRAEQGPKLMNVKTGGGASKGHVNPKHSEQMRGEGNPMYGKDRKDSMAHARSFQNFDSEHYSKIGRMRKDFTVSEETKQKLSENIKASWTEERKAELSKVRRGTGNQMAKVTEDQVREIRQIREATGRSYLDIAVQFGISEAAASLICRRITWKHVE